MNKYIKNKRGITLAGIMVMIIILSSIAIIVAKNIYDANKQKKESEIESNIAILESVSKSYMSANNTYPVINNKPLSSFTKGTALRNFHDLLVEKLSVSSSEIDNRVKLVDIKTLLNDKYLSANIKSDGDYVNDTVTGKIYFIKRDATLSELEKVVEKLLNDSNEITDLTVREGDRFAIEVDGKRMTKIYISATQGKKLIVGGGNEGTSPTDIKLAVVEFDEVDSKTIAKVTDLTPKVKGGSLDRPITDLRILEEGKILVAYYNTTNSRISYEVIEF